MKHGIWILLAGCALCACRSHHNDYDDNSVSDMDSSMRFPSASQSNAQTMPRDASSPSAPYEMSKTSQKSAAMAMTSDRDFATAAAQGSEWEIQSSRLALKSGIAGTHQEFAQKMIDDHGRASEQLTELARKKGWTLPTSMTSAQQRDLDELARLSGPDFDRRYYAMQIKAHDEAIELFSGAADDCDDADLRRFASEALPMIREHRRYLEEHPF